MTEALITELARIRALQVASRTSALQYKGTKQPLPEIARALGVDAVVEGSVLRSGDQVRITVQLIDAATDRHLWSEAYDRPMRDILALQSDVARKIAEQVKVALTPQELQRLARAQPVDPEAYRLYLKGRQALNRSTDARRGIEYFQQAIDEDPSYALAYAGLADAYTSLGGWEGDALEPREAFPRAKAAAAKAIELDPTLGEAHASLANTLATFDWDWSASEREFKRALELTPNYAVAHHRYSHLLLPLRRIEESLQASRRAIELDPLDSVINVHLVWHFHYAREYDRALQDVPRNRLFSRSWLWMDYFSGLPYEQKGMFEEAIQSFQKARGAGGATFAIAALGHAYGMAGRRSDAVNVLSELHALGRQRYVPAFNLALVHAGLRQNDKAFGWLEKAYEERSGWMPYLGIEPRLDNLRSDPRFVDLVKRVGLP